jgi:heme A synthase
MDFYKILLSAHKGFGYLELVLVTLFIVALLVTMFGFSGKVNKFLKKTTLFTMIFFHVQFLIGIIMLIINFTKGLDMGSVMKNADLRFQYVEHPFSMLIAAVLMTIINKKVKSNPTISLGIVIMGLVAVGLFAFAFPWTRVFGA